MMEPYKDKGWLYDHYVKKRRNLTDICDILKNQYGIQVTPQAVYNWCERYDLLRYRGKGRKMAKKGPTGASSNDRKAAEMKKVARQRNQEMRKRKNR